MKKIFRNPVWYVVLFILAVSLACNMPSFSRPEPLLSPTLESPPTDIPLPTASPTPTNTPTPQPEVRVEIAEEALDIGDWRTASEEYNSALIESDDSQIRFAANLGQAKTAFLEGNHSYAIELAEPLILNPDEFSQLTDLVSETYFLLGQAYLEEGRNLDAAESFGAYLELKPGIIDGYIYELQGDAYFAAGEYENALDAYGKALDSPGLIDRTFIEMKKARSYAFNGNYDDALALYDEIYQKTDLENTKALIHLRKGQVYTEIDQLDQAYREYQTSINLFPTAYESYSALVALVEAGVPVDELNRGLVDFFAGEYGAALAAFNRYLINNPPDAGTAIYYSGLAHREGGRYEEALNEWDKIIFEYPDHPYWDDAWEQKGFTQWFYMEDHQSAIQTFLEFVENDPTHQRASEFLDDAARVAERAGDLEQSSRLWKDLTIRYPFDERAVDSLFLSALSSFRLGNYEEALKDFQGTFGISHTLSEKSRALFWIGKSQEASGNMPEAVASYQEASSVDPTGYYSERARDLVLNREPFTHNGMMDFAYDSQTELTKAIAWMKNAFPQLENADLKGLGTLEAEPAILRANELWRLGLQDEAWSEFETLRQTLSTDPELSFRLAQHFSDIGMHRSAAFAARNVLDLAGMNDASSLTAPAFFSRIRFPVLYSDIIIPLSNEYQIHPLLIFSLIRQESLFEAFVQSSASARGLMQIIPSTGEEIARDLNWSENFSSTDLNRPLVNINFGTYYLAKQIEYFDGNLFAALAAYNGGPGNSAQWLKLANNDPDLFLEVIRYSETRLYIRRIYEIFSIYRRLYDRTP